MQRLFQQFLAEDAGATAIEYGLLAAMIAVAIIGSLTLFGDAVANMFGAGGAANVLNEQTAKIPTN